MELQLENRVVLVTGGAKGIGAASYEPPLRSLQFLSVWTMTPKPAKIFMPS